MRRFIVLLPSLVLLGVGAASIQMTDYIHHAQQAERAAHAREAHQAQQAERQHERLEVRMDLAEIAVKVLQAKLDASDIQLAEKQKEIDKLQARVNALTTVSYGLGGGSGMAMANHFSWGYCTWYVASRRSVPWYGNAISWLAGAQAFGFPTGSTPRVGAIMVSAESWWGHVALVETVGSSSFTVSEMNFIGWGVVDWRTIYPGRVPVIGFVY